jgi:hypothetical protein
VRRFLKWTVITAASAAGATLAYQWINAARTRLDRGLEHVEQVAEDARDAVQHTQEALGQTAQTARDIRQTIGRP